MMNMDPLQTGGSKGNVVPGLAWCFYLGGEGCNPKTDA